MAQEEQTLEQVKQKLHDLSEKFMQHYRNKEYGKAKHCYDTALTVACVFGLTQEEKDEVWGNREKNITGWFHEYVVNKVFEETTVKGTWKNVQDMSWEEFELRHAQRNGIGLYAKK